MFKTIITTPAETDLVSSINYITDVLKNQIAANNLLDRFEDKINQLKENPFICPLVAEEYLSTLGIRLSQIGNYFIFYTINEDKKLVTIIRFLFARRDWSTLLK